MSKQFYFKQFRLAYKTVIFQTIQFSISTLFSSIWPIDRSLSIATTKQPKWPGSNGNEGVLRISQSSSITGTSPSDFLVSYPGHSLVVVVVGFLPLCKGAVGIFYSPIQLGV